MLNSLKKYCFYIWTTALVLGGGALLYFGVKFVNTDFILLGSKYDDLIPFVPIFIYPYMIWYPFEAYSLFLLYKDNLQVYIRSIVSIGLSFLTSTLIFALYPTILERPTVDPSGGLTSLIVYLTFKYDNPPVNCLPSNHCILCFIIIFAAISAKGMSGVKRGLLISVNIIIVASTLLVKQHVIIDLIGSLLVAGFYYYLISGWLTKKLMAKYEHRIS